MGSDLQTLSSVFSSVFSSIWPALTESFDNLTEKHLRFIRRHVALPPEQLSDQMLVLGLEPLDQPVSFSQHLLKCLDPSVELLVELLKLMHCLAKVQWSQCSVNIYRLHCERMHQKIQKS